MALFDWIGDLFKSEKEKAPEPVQLKPEEPEFVLQSRKEIMDFIQGKSKFAPQIQSMMSEFLTAGGMLPLFGEAKDFLSEMLTGDFTDFEREFDPYKRVALGELGEAKERLRRQGALGGLDPSSTRLLGGEAELEEQTLDRLMDKLSNLFREERIRKFQAVPLAGEYAETERFLPARIAGIGREFESAPLQYALNMLQNFQPTFYQPSYRYKPSPFESGLGYGKDIASIIGSLYGASPRETTGARDKYGIETGVPSYYPGSTAKRPGGTGFGLPGIQSSYDWLAGL